MHLPLPWQRTADSGWVHPESLNVSPELVGMPLAPPARRVMAILTDMLAIVLLSSTGEFWIAAGISAVVFQLRHRQPGRGWRRSVVLWGTLALLMFVGVYRITEFVERESQLPTAGLSASPTDDDDDDDDGAVTARAALAASNPEARIASLEAQLAEARQPLTTRWRHDALRRLHKLGLGFGWAIAYFTLLPFWWRGQTLGKRLFGLRIVELTGKRLDLMTCFGRYGGYAAGLATGGTGFAQVLWDANRQAIQDKVAHTVVIDLRAPRRAPPPALETTDPLALPVAPGGGD